MKRLFEDPTLRLVLFELHDVLTDSLEPENPDEDTPGGDTPIIGG